MIFVTSNPLKFNSAAAILQDFGLSIERQEHDFTEIQGPGRAIAEAKAQAAYDFYKQPVVVSDDTWEITALGGFPGAYMHPINDWFTADDWLRLMQGVQDRRIVLRQHVVYQDERGQFYAVSDLEGVLLTQARGDSKYTNLTLISFTDGRTSRAEDIAAGGTMVGRESGTAWHKLGEQLTKSEPNHP